MTGLREPRRLPPAGCCPGTSCLEGSPGRSVQGDAQLLPEEAYLAALAGLPHLTPSRLRWLLHGRSPAEAWGLVRAGECLVGASGVLGADEAQAELSPEPGRASRSRWAPADLARAWRAHAAASDPAATWAAYTAAEVSVAGKASAGYPSQLADDPQPPAVLFSLGSPAPLALPRVAVIGTRNCTHYGEEVASELGGGLARAGVCLVSGLAIGIDGAAHRGAVAAGGAPPLAVVGSGLDVVYPARHARLWAQVAAVGAILSEAPLGAPPEAWRFPWRNRLIAALSQVVVVVESHAGGGALLTVDSAMSRGVTVMAVPGSVRSPASAGTNTLIAEGCAPARDTEDVLVALGLSRSWSAGPPAKPAISGPSRHSPAGDWSTVERDVWGALDGEPTPTDAVLRRTGLPLGEVAAALGKLEEEGWARAGEGWWERATR